MWALIVRYAPLITLPIATVIGLVGYHLENFMSDKYTPSISSIHEQREERLLKEDLSDQEADSLKDKKFVPKTIFEKNLSPSLLKPDTRVLNHKP